MRSSGLDIHRGFMEVAVAEGRYALVEAAWSVVKAPGPLRAFTQARLPVWCLLTRGEDYAGQPRRSTRGEGIWKANDAVREAERELAAQAEAAYKRTVADWQRNQARREAAKRQAEKRALARHRGAHLEVTHWGQAHRGGPNASGLAL